MNPIENSAAQVAEAREPLQLSLLNDFLYCPRRAALKLLEGWREANEHTVLGELAHEHTDLPGYEVAKGVLIWRALPVWSERLGLSGRCDIVEVELDANPKSDISNSKSRSASLKSAISNLKPDRLAALRPVEYKKGKRRRFENDDAQVCAQALCLEEMFGVTVERGDIFHAESKRRREVIFTPELRALTERAVADLHALFAQSESSNWKCEISKLPPAVWRAACEECSLFDICLPKATARTGRAERLAHQLFAISHLESEI